MTFDSPDTPSLGDVVACAIEAVSHPLSEWLGSKSLCTSPSHEPLPPAQSSRRCEFHEFESVDGKRVDSWVLAIGPPWCRTSRRLRVEWHKR